MVYVAGRGQVPGISTRELPGLRASFTEREQTAPPVQPTLERPAPISFPVNALRTHPEFLEIAPCRLHSLYFTQRIPAGFSSSSPSTDSSRSFPLLHHPPRDPPLPRSAQGGRGKPPARSPPPNRTQGSSIPSLLPCFLGGKSHVLSRCPIARTTRFSPSSPRFFEPLPPSRSAFSGSSGRRPRPPVPGPRSHLSP